MGDVEFPGNGSITLAPPASAPPSILPSPPSTPRAPSVEERLARLEALASGPRALGKGEMLDLDQVMESLRGSGFEDVEVLPPPAPEQRFRDRSTVILCPTRGQIDSRVVDAWNALSAPMNQRRIGPIFARDYEVGAAYRELVGKILGILQHPQIKTWRYVLTVEDDNIPPPNAHMRLLRAMEEHPEYDGIAGLYHTKDPAQVPMAYGDPEDFKRTGKTLHFPISKTLLDPWNPEPVEVLGIPMGCTLWRMDLFRRCPPSWFLTLSEKVLVDGQLVDSEALNAGQCSDAKKCMTQDLAYCEVAVKYHGARFAVLPSLQVGHLDPSTGVVY